jgi:hypothetical protein
MQMDTASVADAGGGEHPNGRTRKFFLIINR